MLRTQHGKTSLLLEFNNFLIWKRMQENQLKNIACFLQKKYEFLFKNNKLTFVKTVLAPAEVLFFNSRTNSAKCLRGCKCQVSEGQWGVWIFWSGVWGIIAVKIYKGWISKNENGHICFVSFLGFRPSNLQNWCPLLIRIKRIEI